MSSRPRHTHAPGIPCGADRKNPQLTFETAEGAGSTCRHRACRAYRSQFITLDQLQEIEEPIRATSLASLVTTLTPNDLVYLACPMKHNNRAVVQSRCEAATRVAAYLHDNDIPVFSPATHGLGLTSVIAKTARQQPWEYWAKIDLPILTNCCTRLVVLALPGWEESIGVRAEIDTARSIGLPVILLSPWLTGIAHSLGCRVNQLPPVLCICAWNTEEV